ncbi:phosphodiesterase [Actibacterium mucosum KCTC 23349]|uniref:Phosphodiesterase n=1 Tax=Actibacterium mucosum KCTC 23349 TaxID=1454373 RepID=A0A037ZN69_9RHOB|nr:glycerophosphodiester phosphodiesterase family protein [Actibacterium mucosum]KAJ56973.1 phosphodiesterase [Actibacterium mucosum KCTC 23349]
MTALPRSFVTTPIAHRAYHDLPAGRPENSLAAVQAAVDAGYGIEIDIQPSADGVPMVFHDYDLERLTGTKGPVAGKTAAELADLGLIGGGPVPTLAQVLDLVAGQVPLLIEVKDQDGAMGPDVGPLEGAIAETLRGYTGDVALMSFNPHSVAALADLLPDIPRGLTTCAYAPEHWQLLPEARRAELREIADFDRVGASFVSHGHNDLPMPRIAALKAAGVPILCWTIRSPEEEAKAREIADNITFEAYAAPLTQG